MKKLIRLRPATAGVRRDKKARGECRAVNGYRRDGELYARSGRKVQSGLAVGLQEIRPGNTGL